MDYSFYGGRQGASFILAKSYKTIQSMNDDFAKLNCAVNYGEYVIIDTENKNHSDNGKVYIRQEDGTQLYIGQIVGPAGPAPDVEILSGTTAVKNQWDSLGMTATEETDQFGHTIYKTENNDEFGEYVVNNVQTVNGRYESDIKCSYQKIKKASGEETTVFLGFTFPVPYFFISQVVSTDWNNSAEVTILEDGVNAFKHGLRFVIPKGAPGDVIKRFVKIKGSVLKARLNESSSGGGGGGLIPVIPGTGGGQTTYSMNITPLNPTNSISIQEVTNVTNSQVLVFPVSNPSLKDDKYYLFCEIETVQGVNNFVGSQKITTYNFVCDYDAMMTRISQMYINEQYHLIVKISDIENEIDLGSVKSNEGVLIGGNETAGSLNGANSISEIVEALNSKYPTGRDDFKIITVGADEQNKQFYGFDYINDTWYYLGGINASPGMIVGREDDVAIQNKAQTLIEDSIWFVLSN